MEEKTFKQKEVILKQHRQVYYSRNDLFAIQVRDGKLSVWSRLLISVIKVER